MKHKIRKEVKESQMKNHACYVLITCEEPSADGNMQIEMTYEGDAILAAYLLQGAQTIIDAHVDDSRLA